MSESSTDHIEKVYFSSSTWLQSDSLFVCVCVCITALGAPV